MELKLTPRFLQNGQRFFGPGVAELLERVREHRSLRAAAASMEMAYSKAWRIIHEAEEGFGFRLLDSTIGGRHGGGASELLSKLFFLSSAEVGGIPGVAVECLQPSPLSGNLPPIEAVIEL